MTIQAPADGATTSARSAVVIGLSPAGRKGSGYVARELSVNGRRVGIRARRDGSFRREIALEVGRNVISARARIFRSWRDQKPSAVATASSVVLTRTREPGDLTGTLDLATSLLVTDSSGELYDLCGEDADCQTRTDCFSVTATRVDCPTGWREWSRGWGPWRCGFVMSVNLRELLVFRGTYRCRGRWKPDPYRYVRAEPDVRERRFTVSFEGAPWLRKEIADPNRYGVPRFDGERDAFIP